jgi:hypothetical protein
MWRGMLILKVTAQLGSPLYNSKCKCWGSNLKVANLEHKGRGLGYSIMQWQTPDMEGKEGDIEQTLLL